MATFNFSDSDLMSVLGMKSNGPQIQQLFSELGIQAPVQGRKPQNVAGRYSDLSQIPIGQDVKRQVFQKLGMGGGDGYQSWMGDAGVNEGGQQVVNDQLSQAGQQALAGYQFDWQPSGTRNEGTLKVIGPDGQVVGSYQQSDPSTASQMAQAAALAAAGFGGAGLMFGVGPAAGMLGAGGMGGGGGGFAPGAGMGADAAANVAAYANTLTPEMMASQVGAMDLGLGAGGFGGGNALQSLVGESPFEYAQVGGEGRMGLLNAAQDAAGGAGPYMGAAADSQAANAMMQAAGTPTGAALGPNGVNLVNAGGVMSTSGNLLDRAASAVGGWDKAIPLVAQLGSGLFQGYQAGKAADQSAAASQAAINEQRRQFDLTRGDFAPYREAGARGLGLYEQGVSQVPSASDVMAQPGYQFGMDQGMNALQRQIAAHGGRNSGAAQKAATRYGTDYATTRYNDAWAKRNDRLAQLGALAGIGQAATSSTAGAGMNSANAISGLLQNQGDTRAGGTLAQGNIWGNTANAIGALYGRPKPQPTYPNPWGP
jgi:hypothetical protein